MNFVSHTNKIRAKNLFANANEVLVINIGIGTRFNNVEVKLVVEVQPSSRLLIILLGKSLGKS